MATTVEEYKTHLLNNIRWEKQRKTQTGGQQVPRFYPEPITLISDELSISITIGCHRTVQQNRELALTLFTLAMDDIIK